MDDISIVNPEDCCPPTDLVITIANGIATFSGAGLESPVDVPIGWTTGTVNVDGGIDLAYPDGTVVTIPIEFTVNAGSTASTSDDSLGSGTVNNGSILHFWSSDDSIQFTVTDGSAIVDAIVAVNLVCEQLHSMPQEDHVLGDYFVKLSGEGCAVSRITTDGVQTSAALDIDGVVYPVGTDLQTILEALDSAGFTAEAGTTSTIGDNTLGSSPIGGDETLHFYSTDGTVVIGVASGVGGGSVDLVALQSRSLAIYDECCPKRCPFSFPAVLDIGDGSGFVTYATSTDFVNAIALAYDVSATWNATTCRVDVIGTSAEVNVIPDLVVGQPELTFASATAPVINQVDGTVTLNHTVTNADGTPLTAGTIFYELTLDRTPTVWDGTGTATAWSSVGQSVLKFSIPVGGNLSTDGFVIHAYNAGGADVSGSGYAALFGDYVTGTAGGSMVFSKLPWAYDSGSPIGRIGSGEGSITPRGAVERGGDYRLKAYVVDVNGLQSAVDETLIESQYSHHMPNISIRYNNDGATVAVYDGNTFANYPIDINWQLTGTTVGSGVVTYPGTGGTEAFATLLQGVTTRKAWADIPAKFAGEGLLYTMHENTITIGANVSLDFAYHEYNSRRAIQSDINRVEFVLDRHVHSYRSSGAVSINLASSANYAIGSVATLIKSPLDTDPSVPTEIQSDTVAIPVGVHIVTGALDIPSYMSTKFEQRIVVVVA